MAGLRPGLLTKGAANGRAGVSSTVRALIGHRSSSKAKKSRFSRKSGLPAPCPTSTTCASWKAARLNAKKGRQRQRRPPELASLATSDDGGRWLLELASPEMTMQAQGWAPRPSCPEAPRKHETGRGQGKAGRLPEKRLYELPAPFSAAYVLPAGRKPWAARVAFL